MFPPIPPRRLEELRLASDDYDRVKAEGLYRVTIPGIARIHDVPVNQLRFYRRAKRPRKVINKKRRTEESRLIRRFMNLSAPWPEGVWMLAEEGKLRLMRDAGTDNMQDDRCLAVVDLPIHTK